MAELARETGRPLLLLSSRRFDRLHTPAVEAAFGRPLHTWQFGSWWAVEYHPPPRGLKRYAFASPRGVHWME